jgi:3-methyl-2-oxobutanoate hydroxymethyltransferase
VTVPEIRCRKGATPLVCLTAYTAPMASLLDPACDLLLVGDSAAMVVHGMPTTLGISLDLMIAHGQAVMRGSERACVIVDMPFGSFEESPQSAFRNAARVMAETGCAGIKLEGGVAMAETIAFLTARGVPVLAHVGLRPQAVHVMGGYKAQGRRAEEWAPIEADAQAVARAGAFAVVLEGVAEPLAAKITAECPIPTIGIGASAACDGQILVTDDMLGLTGVAPSFVRRYADLAGVVAEGVAAYADDVRARRFPGPEHTYAMRAGRRDR